MSEKLKNQGYLDGVQPRQSEGLPLQTGLGPTDRPDGQSVIEWENPGGQDFDRGLENFISVACSRPPIEVYQDHPAIHSVAKALMVAYRENGKASSDSDPLEYVGDAMRVLRNVTSDADDGW